MIFGFSDFKLTTNIQQSRKKQAASQFDNRFNGYLIYGWLTQLLMKFVLDMVRLFACVHARTSRNPLPPPSPAKATQVRVRGKYELGGWPTILTVQIDSLHKWIIHGIEWMCVISPASHEFVKAHGRHRKNWKEFVLLVFDSRMLDAI